MRCGVAELGGDEQFDSPDFCCRLGQSRLSGEACIVEGGDNHFYAFERLDERVLRVVIDDLQHELRERSVRRWRHESGEVLTLTSTP